MKLSIIACDHCREPLGEPDTDFEVPETDYEQVMETGSYVAEFAGGWQLHASPDDYDPIAVATEHFCPDCKKSKDPSVVIQPDVDVNVFSRD